MFWKKEYTDFVDLSVGRVYIKPVTNGIKNTIFSKSTIVGSTINNAYFFQLWEYSLVCLSRRKIDKLSVVDGNKLREAVKKILSNYGIIKEEIVEVVNEDNNIFSTADKAVLDGQMNSIKQKYGIS